MNTLDDPGKAPGGACILTINGGSSSVKFAAFGASAASDRLLRGRVERVGEARSRLVVEASVGSGREDREVEARDPAEAAALVIDQVGRRLGDATIAAVGHRVVHGGERFVAPEVVGPAMLEELRRLAPLDPDHLPGEIALIEAFSRAIPGVPQVACFDTAFHRTLPRVAQVVPIPRRYWGLGVRRYGFHGLSYSYLMEELERTAGTAEARGRVILAHLGAGASLAAVRDGACVETTMGFTPTSGLVMATRSGDLDPGLVAFLAHAEGMTPDAFQHMINRESGLLGVSGTSADVRDLLAARGSDPRAAEAIEVFCYRVKTHLGALTAALGGLDALVFSGGIGENSPEVRREVCEGLGYLGVALDEARNLAGAGLISADAGRVAVRVIPTDEEIMIARATARLALAAP